MRPSMLCCDLLRLVPFLSWSIVAIVAIPSYARIGWSVPIVAAVFSIVMGAVATRAMWYKGRDLRAYLSLLPKDDADISTAPATTLATRAQVCIAASFTLAAFAWGLLDLVVYGSVLRPQKSSMPCGGVCGLCAEDPNCQAWANGLAQSHGILAVCPTVKQGSSTDATFSCFADGMWLLCTGFIGVLWLLLLAFRCSIFDRSPAQTATEPDPAVIGLPT